MSQSDIEALTNRMISDMLNTDSKLDLYIRGHLYLEHFLDRAIDKFYPNQVHLLDVPYFSSELKLRLLHGSGFLTDVAYFNGKMMGEIRNKFAHRLIPNRDSIKAKISNMLTPWIPEQKLSSMDNYERYRSVAIETILAVKNALDNDRNTDLYPDIKIPDSQK